MRILLVLAFMLGAVAFAGPTDEDAEAAARRVYSDGDYQVELPTDAPPPEARTRQLPERTRERSTTSSRNREPEVSGRSLANFLWYLLIGVVLVGLLLWAAHELMESKLRNLRRPATVTTPAPDARAGPESDLPAPAQLAAEGRYAEAIHALLLVSLYEIHRRSSTLAPAWTSREILYKVSLPAQARDALEELVRAVEFSRFAGIAAGEQDYAACARQAEACRAALPEKAA